MKTHISRWFFPFLTALGAIAVLAAPAASAQVQLQLGGLPPNGSALESPFVADLEARYSDAAQLLVTSTTGGRLRFEVEVEVSGTRLDPFSTPFVETTPGLKIFGMSQDLTYDASREDVLRSAPQLAASIVMSGRLPNGEIRMLVTAYDADDFIVGETEGFWEIRFPGAPELIAPFDGDELIAGQPVVLQWERESPADMPAGARVEYEATMAKVDPDFHRSAEEALRSPLPGQVVRYASTEIAGASVTHTKTDGATGLEMELGAEYAWQVQARVYLPDGRELRPLDEDGLSDVWMFTYGQGTGLEEPLTWQYPATGPVLLTAEFAPEYVNRTDFGREVADGRYRVLAGGQPVEVSLIGVRLDPVSGALTAGAIQFQNPITLGASFNADGSTRLLSVPAEGGEELQLTLTNVRLTPSGLEAGASTLDALSRDGVPTGLTAQLEQALRLQNGGQSLTAGSIVFNGEGGTPRARFNRDGLSVLTPAVVTAEPDPEQPEGQEPPYDDQSLLPETLDLIPGKAQIRLKRGGEALAIVALLPDEFMAFEAIGSGPILEIAGMPPMPISVTTLRSDATSGMVSACDFEVQLPDGGLSIQGLPLQLEGLYCTQEDDLPSLVASGSPRVLGGQALEGATVRMSISNRGQISAGAQDITLDQRIPAWEGQERAVFRATELKMSEIRGELGYPIRFAWTIEGVFELRSTADDPPHLEILTTLYETESGFFTDDWEALDRDRSMATLDGTGFRANLDPETVTVFSFEQRAGSPSPEMTLQLSGAQLVHSTFPLQFPVDRLRFHKNAQGAGLGIASETSVSQQDIPQETFDQGPARLKLVGARAPRMEPFNWFQAQSPSGWAPELDLEVTFPGFDWMAPSMAQAGMTAYNVRLSGDGLTGDLTRFENFTPDDRITVGSFTARPLALSGALATTDGAQTVRLQLDGSALGPFEAAPEGCQATFTATLAEGSTTDRAGLSGSATDFTPCAPLDASSLTLDYQTATLAFSFTDGAQSVTIDGQASATLSGPGFEAGTAEGRASVDLTTGALTDQTDLPFENIRWHYPVSHPFFVFSVPEGRFTAQGMAMTGAAALDLNASAGGDDRPVRLEPGTVTATLDGVRVNPEGALAGGSIAFGGPLAFEIRGGNDQAWGLSPVSTIQPAEDNILRYAFPQGTTLTADGLTMAGTSRGHLKMGGHDDLVEARFTDFSLGFGPARVIAGEANFARLDDGGNNDGRGGPSLRAWQTRRDDLATKDENGLTIHGGTTPELPDQIPLPTLKTAYLDLTGNSSAARDSDGWVTGTDVKLVLVNLKGDGNQVEVTVPDLRLKLDDANHVTEGTVSVDLTDDPVSMFGGGFPLTVQKIDYADKALTVSVHLDLQRVGTVPLEGSLTVGENGLTGGTIAMGTYTTTYTELDQNIWGTFPLHTSGDKKTELMVGAVLVDITDKSFKVSGLIKSDLFKRATASTASAGSGASGTAANELEALHYYATFSTDTWSFGLSQDNQSKGLAIGSAGTFQIAETDGITITANTTDFFVELNGLLELPNLGEGVAISFEKLHIGTDEVSGKAALANEQQFGLFKKKGAKPATTTSASSFRTGATTSSSSGSGFGSSRAVGDAAITMTIPAGDGVIVEFENYNFALTLSGTATAAFGVKSAKPCGIGDSGGSGGSTELTFDSFKVATDGSISFGGAELDLLPGDNKLAIVPGRLCAETIALKIEDIQAGEMPKLGMTVGLIAEVPNPKKPRKSGERSRTGRSSRSSSQAAGDDIVVEGEMTVTSDGEYSGKLVAILDNASSGGGRKQLQAAAGSGSGDYVPTINDSPLEFEIGSRAVIEVTGVGVEFDLHDVFETSLMATAALHIYGDPPGSKRGMRKASRRKAKRSTSGKYYRTLIFGDPFEMVNGEAPVKVTFSRSEAVHIDWHLVMETTDPLPITVGPITVGLEKFSFESDEMKFQFSGYAEFNIPAVKGGFGMRDLTVGLNPFSFDPGRPTGNIKLSINDVVDIEVGCFEHKDGVDVSLDLKKKASQASTEWTTETIKVEEYLRFAGCGAAKDALRLSMAGGAFSGSLGEFLYYKQPDLTSISIEDIEISLKKGTAELMGDFHLQVGHGGFALDVTAIAHLKTAGQNLALGAHGELSTMYNRLSFGIFIAGSGLRVPLIQIGQVPPPVVLLTDVGGGFFYRPKETSVQSVYDVISGLQGKEFKPNNPNGLPKAKDLKFAVMLYAGIAVGAGPITVVNAQGLITITDQFANLDMYGQVIKSINEPLPGDGMNAGAYLTLMYGGDTVGVQGGFNLDIDYKIAETTEKIHIDFSITKKDGEDTVWYIDGGGKLEIMSVIKAHGALAASENGFLAELGINLDLDVAIFEIHSHMDISFWVNNMIRPQELGAYMAVGVNASVFGGIASVGADVKGALLIKFNGDYLIYGSAGAYVKVACFNFFGEHCLFKGNMDIWMSVENGDFHGGTGKNRAYEAQVAESRRLASKIKERSEQTKTQADAAKGNAEASAAAAKAAAELQKNRDALADYERQFNVTTDQVRQAGRVLYSLDPGMQRLYGTELHNMEQPLWTRWGPELPISAFNTTFTRGVDRPRGMTSWMAPLGTRVTTATANLSASAAQISDDWAQVDALLSSDAFRDIAAVPLSNPISRTGRGFAVSSEYATARQDLGEFQEAVGELAEAYKARLTEAETVLTQFDALTAHLAADIGSKYYEAEYAVGLYRSGRNRGLAREVASSRAVMSTHFSDAARQSRITQIEQAVDRIGANTAGAAAWGSIAWDGNMQHRCLTARPTPTDCRAFTAVVDLVHLWQLYARNLTYVGGSQDATSLKPVPVPALAISRNLDTIRPAYADNAEAISHVRGLVKDAAKQWYWLVPAEGMHLVHENALDLLGTAPDELSTELESIRTDWSSHSDRLKELYALKSQFVEKLAGMYQQQALWLDQIGDASAGDRMRARRQALLVQLRPPTVGQFQVATQVGSESHASVTIPAMYSRVVFDWQVSHAAPTRGVEQVMLTLKDPSGGASWGGALGGETRAFQQYVTYGSSDTDVRLSTNLTAFSRAGTPNTLEATTQVPVASLTGLSMPQPAPIDSGAPGLAAVPAIPSGGTQDLRPASATTAPAVTGADAFSSASMSLRPGEAGSKDGYRARSGSSGTDVLWASSSARLRLYTRPATDSTYVLETRWVEESAPHSPLTNWSIQRFGFDDAGHLDYTQIIPTEFRDGSARRLQFRITNPFGLVSAPLLSDFVLRVDLAGPDLQASEGAASDFFTAVSVRVDEPGTSHGQQRLDVQQTGVAGDVNILDAQWHIRPGLATDARAGMKRLQVGISPRPVSVEEMFGPGATSNRTGDPLGIDRVDIYCLEIACTFYDISGHANTSGYPQFPGSDDGRITVPEVHVYYRAEDHLNQVTMAHERFVLEDLGQVRLPPPPEAFLQNDMKNPTQPLLWIVTDSDQMRNVAGFQYRLMRVKPTMERARGGASMFFEKEWPAGTEVELTLSDPYSAEPGNFGEPWLSDAAQEHKRLKDAGRLQFRALRLPAQVSQFVASNPDTPLYMELRSVSTGGLEGPKTSYSIAVPGAMTTPGTLSGDRLSADLVLDPHVERATFRYTSPGSGSAPLFWGIRDSGSGGLLALHKVDASPGEKNLPARIYPSADLFGLKSLEVECLKRRDYYLDLIPTSPAECGTLHSVTFSKDTLPITPTHRYAASEVAYKTYLSTWSTVNGLISGEVDSGYQPVDIAWERAWLCPSAEEVNVRYRSPADATLEVRFGPGGPVIATLDLEKSGDWRTETMGVNRGVIKSELAMLSARLANGSYIWLDYIEFTGAACGVATRQTLPPPPLEAQDDFRTTQRNMKVDVPVLANDTRLQGDPLSIATFDAAATEGGTVVLNNNSTPADQTDDYLEYTPPADFTGTDTFTYTMTDREGSETATVKIQVNAPPTAVDDRVTGKVGDSFSIRVLANDSDSDGGMLKIEGIEKSTGTEQATIAVDENGTSSNTSDDFIRFELDTQAEGVYPFNYTVSDGQGGTATATVEITLRPDNRPPEPKEDKVTVLDQPVRISVLGNDTDPDGDTLTLTAVQVNEGTGTVDGDHVVYTPPATNRPVESLLVYTVSDGNGGTARASVSLQFKEAPVAGDGNVRGAYNLATTVDVMDLARGNGYDLTLVSVNTGATQGTATIKRGAIMGPGAYADVVIYTSPRDWSGTDTFTYTVRNSVGQTATGTIRVEVPAARVDLPATVTLQPGDSNAYYGYPTSPALKRTNDGNWPDNVVLPESSSWVAWQNVTVPGTTQKVTFDFTLGLIERLEIRVGSPDGPILALTPNQLYGGSDRTQITVPVVGGNMPAGPTTLYVMHYMFNWISDTTPSPVTSIKFHN